MASSPILDPGAERLSRSAPQPPRSIVAATTIGRSASPTIATYHDWSACGWRSAVPVLP